MTTIVEPSSYRTIDDDKYQPQVRGKIARHLAVGDIVTNIGLARVADRHRRRQVTDFWQVIADQLDELATARNADEVVRVLSCERNPYGAGEPVAGDGFFAGSGGDTRPDTPLAEAGWRKVWAAAAYWWVMQAPDGSCITYVEGDIYLGDRRPVFVRID